MYKTLGTTNIYQNILVCLPEDPTRKAFGFDTENNKQEDMAPEKIYIFTNSIIIRLNFLLISK